MTRFSVLCGSAPENFRQKKLALMHDFLTSEADGAKLEQNIIIFPHGVSELFLEGVLNNVFDEAAEEDESEILLYICALSEADLHTELTDSACAGVEVVRLGKDEIRKDMIAYYANLAEKMEIGFRVVYEADGEVVSDETLGYEKVG